MVTTRKYLLIGDGIHL